jgi:hypothetical protein
MLPSSPLSGPYQRDPLNSIRTMAATDATNRVAAFMDHHVLPISVPDLVKLSESEARFYALTPAECAAYLEAYAPGYEAAWRRFARPHIVEQMGEASASSTICARRFVSPDEAVALCSDALFALRNYIEADYHGIFCRSFIATIAAQALLAEPAHRPAPGANPRPTQRTPVRKPACL